MDLQGGMEADPQVAALQGGGQVALLCAHTRCTGGERREETQQGWVQWGRASRQGWARGSVPLL